MKLLHQRGDEYDENGCFLAPPAGPNQSPKYGIRVLSMVFNHHPY